MRISPEQIAIIIQTTAVLPVTTPKSGCLARGWTTPAKAATLACSSNPRQWLDSYGHCLPASLLQLRPR